MRDRLLDRIRAHTGQRCGEPLPVPDLCKDAPCCNNGWCVRCGIPCWLARRDNACDLNISLPIPQFLEEVEAALGAGDEVDFKFRCRQLLELFRRAQEGRGQYSLVRNVCGGCRHNSGGRCSECCCSVMENEPACDGYEPR